jgi:hypothetical protein
MRKRRWWTHPDISNRRSTEQFHIMFGTHRKFPDKFFLYYRMSTSFDELLNLICDKTTKWKNVNNKEGRRNYRRMRNELKRATDKAKKEYLENICNEIIEFQRTGCYDLRLDNVPRGAASF